MDKPLTSCSLVVLLALSACTTSSQAQQTQTPAPAVDVDRAAGEFIRALLTKDVETISSLVSHDGVSFPTKWPGGSDPHGLLSPAIGSQLLAQAVLAGDPSCVGYNPTWGAEPARVLVVFDGLPVDWVAVGHSEPKGQLVGFVLTQSSASEWDLTLVLRVDPMPHIREIVDLQQCPLQ